MSTHYQQALSLHKAGRFAEAYEEYRKALQLEPHRGDLKYLAGTLLLQTGNITGAKAFLSESLALQPVNAAALNSLGLCFQSEGDHLRAVELFTKCIEHEPANINGLNNLGSSLTALGKPEQAAAIFARALAYAPDDAGTLYNLGVVKLRLKDYSVAEQYLLKTAEAADDYAPVFNNLGLLYSENNKPELAEQYLRRAVELDGNYADALFNLAGLYMRLKKHTLVLPIANRLLTISPDTSEYVLMYAGCLFEMQNYTEAFPLFRKIIATAGGDAQLVKEAKQKLAFGLQRVGALTEAAELYTDILSQFGEDIFSLHNFAMMRLSEAKLEESVLLFERILAADKDNVEAMINISVALTTINPERAETFLRKALTIEPANADALYNLANKCSSDGNAGEAEELYLRAIQSNPLLFKAYNNLGVVYQQNNRYKDAEEILARGITLAPDSTEMMNNYGNVFRLQGKITEAIKWFDKALEINPKFYEACKNKGMSLLLGGDYKEGWKWYDYRWALDMKLRNYNKPLWTGEFTPGMRLFVYAEQGLGDTIQFIRYLPLLALNGITILFETQPELFDLYSSLPYITKMYRKGEDVVDENDFDYFIPLLNIPGILQPALSVIPPPDDNLTIPEETLNKWKALITKEKPAVAVVWKGNPGHKNDRNRSVPQEVFSTLYNNTDCIFYQLQYGYKEKHPAQNVINCAEYIISYADTAAALLCCDILITVDTSVAHLAGTLRKPAWILVAKAPDWRWGLDASTTAWYHSVTLFRQEKEGSWSEVMMSLEKNLKNIFKKD